MPTKVIASKEEDAITYDIISTEHCVLIRAQDPGHIREYDDLVNDPEIIITMKEVHWNNVTGDCEILIFYERSKKLPSSSEAKMRRLEEVLND